MNKKEILEIRRQFTPERTTVDKICGCYIDGEKNKRLEFGESFLMLPEEDVFKYCDIFRKTLSGTIGKNLMNMEFPLEQEMPDGCQKFLYDLRQSGLKDEILLEEFYDKVIEHYVYGENYLILLVHAVYDVPGKSSSREEMFDASEEVYDFILCSICPVKLTKAGLCYNPESNQIQGRIRDWLIEPAAKGFLFPAFNDRRTDIHSVLYYSKQAEVLQEEFIEEVLGCSLPMTAKGQLETFQNILTETLGDDCDYDTVRNVQENLNILMEDAKESPDPVELTKRDLKILLEKSGASNESMEQFEEEYEQLAGERQTFHVTNLAGTGKMKIQTPDITIQVSKERLNLIETRVIDGKNCLVIPVDDYIEVNGVPVHTLKQEKPEEEEAEEEMAAEAVVEEEPVVEETAEAEMTAEEPEAEAEPVEEIAAAAEPVEEESAEEIVAEESVEETLEAEVVEETAAEEEEIEAEASPAEEPEAEVMEEEIAAAAEPAEEAAEEIAAEASVEEEPETEDEIMEEASVTEEAETAAEEEAVTSEKAEIEPEAEVEEVESVNGETEPEAEEEAEAEAAKADETAEKEEPEAEASEEEDDAEEEPEAAASEEEEELESEEAEESPYEPELEESELREMFKDDDGYLG